MFPVVVKVIFTNPVDRFSVCLLTVLKTYLEAFAFRDAFLEDSFANKLITDLSETVRVEITVLESDIVLFEV